MRNVGPNTVIAVLSAVLSFPVAAQEESPQAF